MADSIEFSILGLDPIMAKLQAVAGTVRKAKGRAAAQGWYDHGACSTE